MTTKHESLAQKYPELASEADGWDPNEVSPGSNKKLNWICSNGHRWEVSPNNRTQKSITGCPYCAGKRPIKGTNDLATLYPHLASEAHGWDPTEYLPKSNKCVEWKCSSGHIWSTAIYVRADGNGCPICANRLLVPGINDLATLHPDLARESNGWNPAEVVAGGHTKLSWKCANGHEWIAQVKKRINGQGCPTCSGKVVHAVFNSLAAMSPQLASEAFDWDPSTVTIRSGQKKKWKCVLGHVYEATVDKRTSGRGCPVCSGKQVLSGYNDLMTVHPNIAKEADGWDPSKYTGGSNKKMNWKCVRGHRWQVQINDRTKGKGRGCPICTNRQLLVGFNDLASKYPDLAKQACGWDPSAFLFGSHFKVDWKCELGHVWSTQIKERTYGGYGCPTCAGLNLEIGFNDLATVAPQIALQADGWDPSTVKAGTKEKRPWKCERGHQWIASVNSRVGGRNCPTCSGKKVLQGFNDLATTYPVIASQAYGWDPTTITMGSDKKLAWQCDEGHIWNASVSKRVSGRGCPSCAKSGFDQGKDGWLYFIHHDHLDLYQIGITNVPDDRLQRHMSRGWEFLEIRGPMNGQLTQDLETQILRAVLKRGGLFANKSGFERFDGWSEAWTKKSLPTESLKQLLEYVYLDETPQPATVHKETAQ